MELIDTLAAASGLEALWQVLTSFTDEKGAPMGTLLHDKSLLERSEALKGIYVEDDAHMELNQDEASGELRLVERKGFVLL